MIKFIKAFTKKLLERDINNMRDISSYLPLDSSTNKIKQYIRYF